MKMIRTFFTLFLALTVITGFAQKKPKISQAKTALEEGDYAEAKSIVDAAIVHEKTKEDPITWFVRGQVYAALDTANNEPGALETSLEAFDKTLELDPDQKKVNTIDFATGTVTNVESKKQGYYSYYYNRALDGYNSENFTDAANYFETAFYIMPSDTNAILNAAYSASLAKDDEKANRNFNKAYEAGVRDMNIFLQLYNYAFKKENFDDALDAIKKGREAYPNDIDLMKYEVNLYIQMEKIDEARQGIEKAIKAEPENTDLLFTLGVLKDESGDKEGALEAYNSALEVDPNHFNSLFNLGVISYNKASELVKEQGSLNYYPGKSRPDANEKKRYEELETMIEEKLKETLPTWEKLYTLNDTDLNVLQTLQYIYNGLKKTEQYNKISSELEALQEK
ncbi:MAG: tetratricopeptide repeat protein [Ekhidna sp.]|nr:tetratricopeptide repeat protein [Ekhidna sp.]